MIPVNSRAIRAVGYDGSTLSIQFHSSTQIYDFPGVPYSVFEEFMHAPSKGEYYSDHIRGRYG